MTPPVAAAQKMAPLSPVQKKRFLIPPRSALARSLLQVSKNKEEEEIPALPFCGSSGTAAVAALPSTTKRIAPEAAQGSLTTANSSSSTEQNQSGTALLQQRPSTESNTGGSYSKTTQRRLSSSSRHHRDGSPYDVIAHAVVEYYDAKTTRRQAAAPFGNGNDDNAGNEIQVDVARVRAFLSCLPPPYTLVVAAAATANAAEWDGSGNQSDWISTTVADVLLHLRLVESVRRDKRRVRVLVDDLHPRRNDSLQMVVTIVCVDSPGLLECLARALLPCEIRHADVMQTTDGIVLDRFIIVNGEGAKSIDSTEVQSAIEGYLAQQKRAKQTIGSKTGGVAANSPSIEHVAVPLAEVVAHVSRGNLQQHTNDDIDDPLPMLKQRRWQSFTTTTIDQAASSSYVQLVATNTAAPAAETFHREESQPVLVGNTVSIADRPALCDLSLSPLSIRETTNVVIPTAAMDNAAVAIPTSPPTIIPFRELSLIETIARGRVSTIYRAVWQKSSHQRQSAETVALKVAICTNNKANSTSNKSMLLKAVDELKQEADIAARLCHPNVVRLAGIATNSDCFCVAYDYCAGGSLLSLLQQADRTSSSLPLFENNWLALVMDICRGMAYVHSQNIIHRDLKPANILLNRDYSCAKIADFGLSTFVDDHDLTGETGSYRYMAPEVIRHEVYSSSADVYSFGILLWQVLTRQPPFHDCTPVQAAHGVATGRRPAMPTETPQALTDIVTACWHHDRTRRPTFGRVLEDLEGFRNDSRTEAAAASEIRSFLPHSYDMSTTSVGLEIE